MDPREKREDETWAEYGARMASMGIAPGMAAVPLAAGIRRPGRRGPRTLTPEQVVAREASRQKVADQQLSRNIQRIAAEETPVQSRSAASAVRRGDTSLQEADDLRRKEQAAIEKQTRVGGKVVKALAPFAKIAGPVGVAYEALRSEPAVASELPPGVIPGDFRVTQAYPSMNVEEGYPNVSTLPSFDISPDAGGAVGGYPAVDYGQMAQDWGDPTMMAAPTDPTGGLIDIDALAGRFSAGPTSTTQVGGIPSGRTFGVPAAEGYGYVETPYSFTGDFNGQPRTDVYSGSDPGLETVTPLFDALTMGTGIKGAIAVGKVLSNLDRVPSTHSLPGMRFSYRDWPNQRLAPFSNTPVWRGTTKVNPVTPASVLNKPAAQIAVGLTPDVVGVTQQPAYTGGDPTIPGLNPALANPNITAMNTLSEDFDELAFGAFGTKHVPGTSLPVTPPDSMLMQDFIDKYGPVQSGTRDAYYHRDGTVRNAAGDIVSTPDATYNEYAGMGQVASHPGQGGYIGDTERTIGEHLAAVNERVQAMPAVTTSQALSTQDEQQQAMPEVSVPAPTAPTVAAVAAQNRLAQQQADAAMARAAQEAALRDQARQAAQRAAVQADIAAAQAEQDRVRQAKALMNSKSYQESGLDGLSAAERDIVAAAQVDTFAGINRQVRGDRDTSGERSAGMGGGRGGFAGPDRW